MTPTQEVDVSMNPTRPTATTPIIKAIETRYAGCHFRSRLEARWAVFFDHLGIQWEYEPQGFAGQYDTHYLPDFHLPHVRSGSTVGVYVEVKGSDEQLRADSRKIGLCVDYKSTPVSDGLLILGPVPRVRPLRDMSAITHPLLEWRKGVESSEVQWTEILGRSAADPKFKGSEWALSNLDHHPSGACRANETEKVPDEVRVDAMIWGGMTVHEGNLSLCLKIHPNSVVVAAYDAARSARFEHGQSGAT